MRRRYALYLQRTSAGGKLAAGAALAAATVAAPDFYALAPVLAVAFACAALIRGGVPKALLGAAGVATLAAAAWALKWMGAGLPAEAARLAIAPSSLLAGKILTLAVLAALLGTAAAPDELARLLYAPLRALRRLGWDAAPFALTASFAFRFFPAFGRRYRKFGEAVLLRAPGAGLVARFRLIPLLLINAYKGADETARITAAALTLRGCRRAADYLDARRPRRPVGWPAVIVALSAAGVSGAARFLWPAG